MKTWIKKIFQNKFYNYILLGYLFTQLSILISLSSIAPLLHLLFFISTILVGIFWIIKQYKKNRSFIALGGSIALNFSTNIILIIIYTPTLFLNPSINWTLNESGAKGEFDPIMILGFFPLVHFIFSLIIFGITGLMCKILTKKKSALIK